MTRSVTENETDDRTAKRTELKEQATKTKEDASDLVGLVRDVAREEFAHWRSAATEGVTGHPKSAMLIAAGAGLLLGLFLRRR